MLKLSFITGSILALACSSAPAASSSFSTDDEGWRIVSFVDLSANNYSIVSPVGGYVPTYNAAGGNPGGYISQTDPDGGDFTFSAPATFLGNASGAYNTNFSYDLNYTTTVNYQAGDVILTNGDGASSVSRLVYVPTTSFVPTPSFQTVSISLSATNSQWHVNSTTGATPTATEFQNVLANLSGLYIRGEYAIGSDAAGLDNVNLAVPEPASALVLGGCVAIAAMRRRPARDR